MSWGGGRSRGGMWTDFEKGAGSRILGDGVAVVGCNGMGIQVVFEFCIAPRRQNMICGLIIFD